MTDCSVEGCSKPIKARGLCSAHYAKQMRQEKALKQPTRGRQVSRIIYVSGQSENGPINVGMTYNIESVYAGQYVQLFAAFLRGPVRPQLSFKIQKID